MNNRPCKWCKKLLKDHEEYYGSPLFCPNQRDEPPEVMDYFLPMDNIEYLEWKYGQR